MPATAQKFAFGVFEADPKSGELRKNGFKVKIQEQPFQVLLMLLEHPGDVVTREELRQRLWPADTFVDFDHGLNTAINKLREAVGDTASNPRFVETLARRGYRFIAPVKCIDAPFPQTRESARAGTVTARSEPQGTPASAVSEEASAKTMPETSTVAAQPGGSEVVAAETGELPIPSRWIPRTLFALAQLMYLIFYGVALVRLERIPEIATGFLGSATVALVPLVLVTATAGIALRLYLMTAVTFDYKLLGAKFKRLFPAILPLDMIWALSPFLLVPQIGIGGAFAACAALLYLPFSERTLMRMAYEYPGQRGAVGC